MASAVATMAATASSSSASKSRRCVASPCASEGIAARRSSMFGGEHGAELESRCNRGRALLQCNLKALRDRIQVVKNTQKLTDAMRLVAAAKVRRAQEAVVNGRPFSETLVRVLFCVTERIQGEDVQSPLIKVRPVKKVALVMVSGDRGLCGGYNNFIIKKAEERARQLKSNSVDVILITVGTKCNAYFEKRTEFPLHKQFTKGAQPTAADAQAITDELFALFVSEAVDKVEIIYSKFVSLIKCEPVIQTLLPLSPQGQVCDINGNCVDATEDEMFRLSTSEGRLTVERETFTRDVKPFSSVMMFEPDPTQLLDALYPLYLNSQILRALQEAVASELASRMNAMSKASDNAGELGKTLQIMYNRQRQAKVTTEILEIVAGAEAA